MTEEQIRDLVKECGLDWQRGYMPLFDSDTTNRYAVLVEAAIEAEHERHRIEVHSCGPTCTMVGCVNARLRADFARECSDTDELLRMICIDTQDMRTDGGSLNLAKVRELIVDLVSAERERISDLVRDTYQDHLTIDSMCEAIRAKA